MQPELLWHGRQYGKSCGDRFRWPGNTVTGAFRTSGADQGFRLPGDPPDDGAGQADRQRLLSARCTDGLFFWVFHRRAERAEDRKSTRLNSSHLGISYAVFCLKKKTQTLV